MTADKRVTECSGQKSQDFCYVDPLATFAGIPLSG
jgi:hypothetical protein